MSITVRLFSNSDLLIISEGGDKFLTTVFVNGKTFSSTEMKIYSKIRSGLKTYQVFFNDGESINIKAIDSESLKWFLSKEYKTEYIEAIDEIKTQYIPVDIEDLKK